MKYIVFFIVIFTTIPSVMAQTIEVEGHVRDSERNDLIGATVCCFTSDTLLVASMITDSKGDFRLKLSGSLERGIPVGGIRSVQVNSVIKR